MLRDNVFIVYCIFILIHLRYRVKSVMTFSNTYLYLPQGFKNTWHLNIMQGDI